MAGGSGMRPDQLLVRSSGAATPTRLTIPPSRRLVDDADVADRRHELPGQAAEAGVALDLAFDRLGDAHLEGLARRQPFGL